MFLRKLSRSGEIGIEQIIMWLLAIGVVVVAGIAIRRGILAAG